MTYSGNCDKMAQIDMLKIMVDIHHIKKHAKQKDAGYKMATKREIWQTS
jgi:hypothetical protein